MANESSSKQRKSERLLLQVPVTVVTGHGNEQHRVTTVDFCSEGMRTHSAAPLAKDQRVQIRLAPYPNQFIQARVAWVGGDNSPQSGQVGFEFLPPVPRNPH